MKHKNSRDTSYTTQRHDIVEMLPKTAMNILDIGCSNGSLGSSLKQASHQRKVVGVEIDPAFCEEARYVLNEVICTDINDLNWPNQFNNTKFDCIIFADVLEHLINPDRHLFAARNYLTENGCIIISLPNIRHISSFYSIFINGTFPRRERGIFDKTHLHWFTITDAKKCISDAGMVVDEISYALRLGDKGGGIFNRIMNKMPLSICHFFLVREFFAYQVCIRAGVKQ